MKHTALKRFTGNQSGSILLLVGLSFLFLVGIAGAGYDLGRQQLVRQKMQQASDTAALAAANIKCTADPCDARRIVALRYYNLNFPETYLGVSRPVPLITVPAGGPVQVDASAQMDTQFVANMGFTQLGSTGHTVVNTGGGGAANFDVLLMLDTSGSMRDAPDGTAYGYPNKLMALQQAAITLSHSLLDTNANLPCASDLKGCNRIAVLPYSLGAPVYTMYQNSDCNCMHVYNYVNCCGGGCGGPPGGGGEGDASDIFGKKFFAGLGSCLIGDAKAQSACSSTGCGGSWTTVRAINTCNTYASSYHMPQCTTFDGQHEKCNQPPDCIVTGNFATPPKSNPDSNGEIWGCFPDALVDSDTDQMNYCEQLVSSRPGGGDCKFHTNYSSDFPWGFDYNYINVIGHLPYNAYGKTNSGDAFHAAMDPAGIPPYGNATAAPLVLLPNARLPADGVAKVVIWLTDGDNTAWTNQNVVDTSCSGPSWAPTSCTGHINFGSDATADNRWGGGVGPYGHIDQDSDDDTRRRCAELKSQSPPTIIYTIGFGVDAAHPGSRAYNLLRDCATDSGHFMVAPDAATLQQTFHDIFDDLKKIRITE